VEPVGIGACGHPAPNNKVPFPDDQINRDLKIGEGGAKVIGDLLLPAGPGSVSTQVADT
jgi:hypothetical protein